MNKQLLEAIVNAPILPTLLPCRPDVLCHYADVLHEEGYPVLEVLARPLDEALSALTDVFRRPQRRKVYWGIGTIRTREIALKAAALQPDFLVSPAFSRRVLEVAVDANIPYIPAVYTFQDVQDVLDAFGDYGLEVSVLKLCPVHTLVPQHVEGLRGCFPGIVFCPTGEVDMNNYLHWKKIPGIVAPMGSRFIPQAAIEGCDGDAIRQRLRLLRSLAQEADRG